MISFVRWVKKQIEAATKRELAKSELNDGLEGPFIKAWACIECAKELSWSKKMGSLGTCPHCGNTVPGTIVDTVEFTKRQAL